MIAILHRHPVAKHTVRRAIERPALSLFVSSRIDPIVLQHVDVSNRTIERRNKTSDPIEHDDDFVHPPKS